MKLIITFETYLLLKVFVRELISNASDALEKRRIQEHTAPSDLPLEIRINVESEAILFRDTGVGMDRNDLVQLIGTIAKSGSREFRGKDSDAAREIIGAYSLVMRHDERVPCLGQFGVGFYSAFMVADKIILTTKKHDENAVGYRWTYEGGNTYEIAEAPDATPGCTIRLQLRDDDAKRFASAELLTEIIEKYSNFVQVPIFVNDEQINKTKAIWTLNATEITRKS